MDLGPLWFIRSLGALWLNCSAEVKTLLSTGSQCWLESRVTEGKLHLSYFPAFSSIRFKYHTWHIPLLVEKSAKTSVGSAYYTTMTGCSRYSKMHLFIFSLSCLLPSSQKDPSFDETGFTCLNCI